MSAHYHRLSFGLVALISIGSAQELEPGKEPQPPVVAAEEPNEKPPAAPAAQEPAKDEEPKADQAKPQQPAPAEPANAEELTEEEEAALDELPDAGQRIILGQVLTNREGAPVANAKVTIKELNRTTTADNEGRFRFDGIPLGNYSIEFYAIGFQTRTEDAIVDEGDASPIIAVLLANGEEQDDIYETETVNFLEEYEEPEEQGLIDLKLSDSSNLKSGLGKEEFSKSGVSDAGDAVGKIAGANIVGGRYAVVRGLGDRYSNTLVNGAQISSADPSKKAVQLDLFPSNLLESVNIYKTYSPDLPAEWAGGLVEIQTLRFVEERIFDLQVGTTWNSNLGGTTMLVDPGKDMDFFGDADYDLPDSVRSPEEGFPSGYRGRFPLDSPRVRPSDREAAAEAASAMTDLHLSAQMRPDSRDSRLGTSFSITYGESFKLTEDITLGVISAFNHSERDDALLDVTRGSFFSPGPDPIFGTPGNNDPFLGREALEDQFSVTTEWGALLGLGLKIGERHEIGMTYLRNSSSQQNIRFAERQTRRDGDAPFVLGPNRTPAGVGALLYNQYTVIEPLFRDLELKQFYGKHYFGDPDAGAPLFEWAYSSSEAIEERPHSRTLVSNVVDYTDPRIESVFNLPYDPTQGVLVTAADVLAATQGTPTLSSFRETLKTIENSESMSADLTIPLHYEGEDGDFWNIKVGAASFERERSVRGRAFAYTYPLRFNPTIADFPNNGEFGADYLESWNSANDPNGDPKFNGWVNILADSLYIQEFTRSGRTIRNVDAFSTVEGSYVMSQIELNGWNLLAGARFEQETRGYNIIAELNSAIPGDTTVIGERVSQDFDNILPAIVLNRSFGWEDEYRFTAGWSRTVARPTFYEFAPVFIQDQATGLETIGNPNLVNTEIDNFDLRFEYFNEEMDTFAISLFHKDMTNPIAQSVSIGRQSWVNGNKGFVQGIEFESRQQLTDNWSITGNYTFINSLLQYNQIISQGEGTFQVVDSSFEGQPSHILNLILGYTEPDAGFSANLIYNFTGSYLVGVPANNTVPAIRRDAFHQLDLVLSQEVDVAGSVGIVKLKVSNLLDETDTTRFEDTDLITNSFNPGRGVSLSFEMNF